MGKIILLIIGVLFAAAACTNAAVLTFDDIGTGNGGIIPDGYGRFNWGKSFSEGVFYYLNANMFPDSGFNNGRVSGNYVSHSTPYMTEGKGWLTGEPFTFNGAYFTAAWRDGLNPDFPSKSVQSNEILIV